MTENKSIRFIKPCRLQDEDHRELTAEYAQTLIRKGKIIQINLDNCSIQRMERLPQDANIEDAAAVGLLPLVRILQSAPVALSAIGINEMPDRYVAGARRAYEQFCATFWPGHKNDAAATHRVIATNSDEKNIEFSALDEGSRSTYGPAYVALLQMQNIRRTYSSLSSTEQFDAYIHSMIGMLDVISAFELELAKYAFWRPAQEDLDRLPAVIHQRRSDIKDNFTHLQGTVAKCKRAAFNSAMDLHWLSGANMSEEIGILLDVDSDRLVVDQWVGTNDIKLYRISNDMHSVRFENSNLKRFASMREPELAEQKYWQDVDRRANDILSFRMNRCEGVRNLLERIDRSVRDIEANLLTALPE